MNKPFMLTPANSFIGTPDCDCDCACSLPTLSSDRMTIAAQSWHQAPHQIIWHNADWTALFLPHGPTSLVVLNAEGRRIWERFTMPYRPCSSEEEAFIAQAAASGLLWPAQTPPPAPTPEAAPTQLSAWLHLTNACNLRCDYCYLHKTAARMSSETGIRIVDRLIEEAKRHHYPGIKLKYAGGEPLINFQTLQSIQVYAEKRVAAAGLALETVLITNGTLLDETNLMFLKEHHIRLAVSLDGLGASHDSQRHFADGRGSFEIISQNLALARRLGIQPLINITITGKNASHLPELVAFLLQKGYRFTFNLYRENIFAQDQTALALEDERIIQALLTSLDIIDANLPAWSLLGALTDRANLHSTHQYTCSAGRNYLVFDHNGRIAQCQMLIHRPVSDLNDPTPLETVQLASTAFANDRSALKIVPADKKSECTDCPWRYYCAGGCPLEAKRATGSFASRSPNCQIYQAIFPRLLELEARRLVHHHQTETTDRSRSVSNQPAAL